MPNANDQATNAPLPYRQFLPQRPRRPETGAIRRQGWFGKMYQLFGAKMDTVLDELNEALAA
jgi:hypothetical protein